jgi:hypothetical protein
LPKPASLNESSSTPIDTESNINVDEHQESPIDLINNTAKMRHLETLQQLLCNECYQKDQGEIKAEEHHKRDLKVLIVDCRINSMQ